MPARERIQSSRLRPRDETEDPPDDSGVTRSHDESETDRLIDDLEEGLKIDKNALDDALEQQADLFYRVAKALALTISQHDALKQQIGEREAVLDSAIRSEAARSETKLTEKAIESKLKTHAEIQRLTGQLLSLKQSIGKLEALRDSFMSRSHALGHLVKLYTAGYFGDVNNSNAERQVARPRNEPMHLRERG
jgi:hypothetical protein